MSTAKYGRILICGGRNFHDEKFLYGYLDSKHDCFAEDSVFIHGAAKGADSLGGQWARNRGYTVEEYPAQWNDLDHPDAIIKINKWGKPYNWNAGFCRNKDMLVEGRPDLVIAFPGGGGTQNMVDQASNAKVKVIRVWPKPKTE